MDPLDRELASLLSVEPSPEFRARVRARIASEPLPRPWYLQWRVAAAGAAAAAFVAAVAIVRVAPTQPSRTAVVLVENGRAAPVPAVDPAPEHELQGPRVVVAGVAPRRSPRANGPEVLVDASARRGLRQLDALVREGRTRFVFDEETVPQEPITAIVVTPIVIEPIAVASVSEQVGDSEGDGQ